MKLLEEFKRQLQALGTVRRVWLTSFSISVEFVENYLLPAILGIDPPRNRMDVELMQQTLAELQQEGKLDLRIFADIRVLSDSVERKRTTLAVAGVAPNRCGFADDSLFHPKVIYLENDAGRALLGCGSANLTIGGWAHNQEVFLFRRISTPTQVAQVNAFFGPLFTALTLPLPAIASQLWDEVDDWDFCHSFQKNGLVAQLAQRSRDGAIAQLAVWSPYFSDDLAALLQAIRRASGNDKLLISLVPDRTEANLIRTQWSAALGRELDDGSLRFHRNDRVLRDPRSKMCHAKVWLTPEAIAIGSWNCTKPGAQLLPPLPDGRNANNIEAGIVLPSAPDMASALGRVDLVRRQDFCTNQQLAEDALQLPAVPPIELIVRFDWRRRTYDLRWRWTHSALEHYSLKLPDLPPIALSSDQTPNAWAEASYVVENPEEIVVNHTFLVDQDGATVLRGFIEELDTGYRRGKAYASIDDLLESLVNENEGPHGVREVVRGAVADDNLDDDGVAALAPTPMSADCAPLSSYFRLFHAMHNYQRRLESCTALRQLEYCVMANAGCLVELREKIEQSSSPDMSNIYRWFLVQEFNTLVDAAIKQRAKFSDHSAEHEWSKLRLNVSETQLSVETRRYMALIREEYSYA